MKKCYVLLSANNVDTDINIQTFCSIENAKAALEDAFEDLKNDAGNNPEAEIDESGMSAYINDDNGDLYYWQIREIEFPED